MALQRRETLKEKLQEVVTSLQEIRNNVAAKLGFISEQEKLEQEYLQYQERLNRLLMMEDEQDVDIQNDELIDVMERIRQLSIEVNWEILKFRDDATAEINALSQTKKEVQACILLVELYIGVQTNIFSEEQQAALKNRKILPVLGYDRFEAEWQKIVEAEAALTNEPPIEIVTSNQKESKLVTYPYSRLHKAVLFLAAMYPNGYTMNDILPQFRNLGFYNDVGDDTAKRRIHAAVQSVRKIGFDSMRMNAPLSQTDVSTIQAIVTYSPHFFTEFEDRERTEVKERKMRKDSVIIIYHGQEIQLSSLENKIYEYLLAHKQGITVKDLTHAFAGESNKDLTALRQRVYAMIHRMKGKGIEIEVIGSGMNNKYLLKEFDIKTSSPNERKEQNLATISALVEETGIEETSRRSADVLYLDNKEITNLDADQVMILRYLKEVAPSDVVANTLLRMLNWPVHSVRSLTDLDAFLQKIEMKLKIRFDVTRDGTLLLYVRLPGEFNRRITTEIQQPIARKEVRTRVVSPEEEIDMNDEKIWHGFYFLVAAKLYNSIDNADDESARVIEAIFDVVTILLDKYAISVNDENSVDTLSGRDIKWYRKEFRRRFLELAQQKDFDFTDERTTLLTLFSEFEPSLREKIVHFIFGEIEGNEVFVSDHGTVYTNKPGHTADDRQFRRNFGTK